jgi:hypothetical protein
MVWLYTLFSMMTVGVPRGHTDLHGSKYVPMAAAEIGSMRRVAVRMQMAVGIVFPFRLREVGPPFTQE